MSQCACSGWWQQTGFGRQMVSELKLSFQGQKLSGTGVDVIAPFDLNGTLGPDGTVEILKQYEHRHSVVYVGQYDGEGTLYGTWAIGGDRGEWSIHLDRTRIDAEMAIQEVQPITPKPAQ
ncbi:MAG: hypothetical protein AB8B50_17160 [Pirellulaceae bacterium]